MKIAIYGNCPWVPTGYGVQIGHLARNLKRDGHEVAILSTYGQQAGVRTWESGYGPVTIYPNGIIENSLDSMLADALHFFGGDPRGGWIISLTDQWVLNGVWPVDVDGHLLGAQDFNILAWTPVDHWPVPPGVLKFCHKAARVVAMSLFGQQQLIEAGVAADFAPLAVDTKVYKPTPDLVIGGDRVKARELLGLPESADFVVVMTAMNKDPDDRKNFNGALRAFGRFWRERQNAVLYMHTDPSGKWGSGIDLRELAKHAAIPPHALFFTEPNSLRFGWTPEMMAALYTAADVLLCPSKGEGFGVPMIEAQACGTPVIATDFTAQAELVGSGWRVSGQLEYDPRQAASYLRPSTDQIAQALMAAYDAKDDPKWSEAGITFAREQFDVDVVYDRYWRPILAKLDGAEPPADKPPLERIDVIVPFLRNKNRVRFTKSLEKSGWDCGRLIVVEDENDTPTPTRSYAQNVNRGYADSDADWVLVVGDDCEFLPGWVEAIRDLSVRYDVIGTNDSLPGEVRNPKVANGSHADHFAVRRAYVEDDGACLDGPGALAPECYRHWYTDVEIVELAKARGVYGHAHDARVVHWHPGYAGDEDARLADPVYMAAVDGSDTDRKTWIRRAPIVAGYRGR